MTRVFISARPCDGTIVRRLQSDLILSHIHITHDWSVSTKTPSSLIMIEAIKACDILVVLLMDPSSAGAATNTHLGIALALGKRVFVFSSNNPDEISIYKENMLFMGDPHVRTFASIEMLLCELTSSLTRRCETFNIETSIGNDSRNNSTPYHLQRGMTNDFSGRKYVLYRPLSRQSFSTPVGTCSDVHSIKGTMLLLHGGCFQQGDERWNHKHADKYASQGIAIMTLDFRQTNWEDTRMDILDALMFLGDEYPDAVCTMVAFSSAGYYALKLALEFASFDPQLRLHYARIVLICPIFHPYQRYMYLEEQIQIRELENEDQETKAGGIVADEKSERVFIFKQMKDMQLKYWQGSLEEMKRDSENLFRGLQKRQSAIPHLALVYSTCDENIASFEPLVATGVATSVLAVNGYSHKQICSEPAAEIDEFIVQRLFGQ